MEGSLHVENTFRRKHLISFLLFLSFLIFGFIGLFQNSISDKTSIVEFVIQKLWPLVLIIAAVYSYVQTFGYDKKQNKWKVFLSFVIVTVIHFELFFVCFQGTFELINSNLGNPKTVQVSGPILEKTSKKQKLGNSTFTLLVLFESDTLELNVSKVYFEKYQHLENFKEDMNKGLLEFLYKRN